MGGGGRALGYDEGWGENSSFSSPMFCINMNSHQNVWRSRSMGFRKFGFFFSLVLSHQWRMSSVIRRGKYELEREPGDTHTHTHTQRERHIEMERGQKVCFCGGLPCRKSKRGSYG